MVVVTTSSLFLVLIEESVLRNVTAAPVEDFWIFRRQAGLRGELAKRLSTRSVRLARMIPIQAIRNAVVNDLVVRNVADLAAVPLERRDGRLGRSTWSRLLLPSRSVRCSRAEERPTEAKTEPLGFQLGSQNLDRWND
jgi:hypothetical protein